VLRLRRPLVRFSRPSVAAYQPGFAKLTPSLALRERRYRRKAGRPLQGRTTAQPRRSGAPKAESEGARRGDQRANCYGATPTGDTERVFVTV
jgi:hypothetical protein